MLQALGLPLPKQILSHAHWTVNRQKMSKSIGNVADPFKAMDELGVDLVRYYLARVGGRFKDDVGTLRDELLSFLLPLCGCTLTAVILRLVAGAARETCFRAAIFTWEFLPSCHLQSDSETIVPGLPYTVRSTDR